MWYNKDKEQMDSSPLLNPRNMCTFIWKKEKKKGVVI